MGRAPFRWTVALDGGTTNTRARLVHDGRVIATARRGVGVRDAVLSEGEHALAAAVRDAVNDVLAEAGGIRPESIVAAGMLSSEVGLTAVPHADAPAGIDELARAAVARDLPSVADQPILFIPGIRTPASQGEDGWSSADVMRGEECETLGAWSSVRDGDVAARAWASRSSTAFLWPGSHTKLVEVDREGTIVRSHTTLAGELTQALAQHTLIAASLPANLPDEPDRDAFATGARTAARDGLGRTAFLVRVAALTGALNPQQRAAFWVGAVIGDDVAALARHSILASAKRVLVGGRQPQRSLYARLLRERCGGLVAVLPDEVVENASAVGAIAIAQRHREICGP
jgi:2-dehydro-3-deoxygalactonokinase